MSADEATSRLRSIFLAELHEQLREMSRSLLALEQDPSDAERLRSLFRSAHTLKGAAGAAGVPEIESTCHQLEALLAGARDGALHLGQTEFAKLFESLDILTQAERRLLTSAATAPDRSAAPTEGGAGPMGAMAGYAVPPRQPAEDILDVSVRVSPEKLDTVSAATAELLLAAQTIERRRAKAYEVQDGGRRCLKEWSRLRRDLERGAGGTAAGSAFDDFEQELRRLLDQGTQLALQASDDAKLLSRLASAVGESAHRLRMRPFAEACESLPRIARDLAVAAGKEVRLLITGGEVGADRVVLDALREALLHLVRNAVDHGIELPVDRRERRKDPAGVIRIHAGLRGDRVVVTVSDDGAGIDMAAVRTQLARRGHETPAEPAALSDALFAGGVSTREEATTTSGRGVGLNAVRAAMERVRGRVELEWQDGEWTRFTLECPLTLAAMHALLVVTGDQILALPVADVERLALLPPTDVRRAQGRDVVPGGDEPIPLVHLGRLLGISSETRPAESRIPVVTLRSGQRRLALAVDELLAEQEVIARPLQAPGKPSYIAGGAVLGGGEIALVLDAPELVAAALVENGASAGLARPITTPARRTIVLVDDSMTTRSMEQGILEGAGYDVVCAADGAEAWTIIQERGCDLVVSDIEMPNMDGFALSRAVRSSKRFAGLPVVLVTALDTPADRTRGLEAGADAYLIKSSFDQEELLATIERLLGAAP